MERRRSSDADIAVLQTEMRAVNHRLDEIERTLETVARKDDVKELVDAWRAATGLVLFIKWVSVIGGAVVIVAKWGGLLWQSVSAKVGL